MNSPYTCVMVNYFLWLNMKNKAFKEGLAYAGLYCKFVILTYATDYGAKWLYQKATQNAHDTASSHKERIEAKRTEAKSPDFSGGKGL